MRKQIKRVATSVVALSTLLAFSFVGLATAGSGTDTCTWTGATNDNWNDAGNWTNCSSGVPVSGDSLVFDNSSLTAYKELNNDISGLALGSITFTGNTAHSFSIEGNDLSLSGGLINTVSGSGAASSLNIKVTLTANQTFDKTSVYGGTDIGSFTLTLSNNSYLSGSLSGSGTIQANTGIVTTQESNPDLTANIVLESGSYAGVYALPDADFGSASFVIKDGAYLSISSYEEEATFSNDVTVAGQGADIFGSGKLPGAIIACLNLARPSGSGGQGAGPSTCESQSDSILNFTGTFTLTGDTVVTGDGGYSTDTQSGGTATDKKATFVIAGEFVSNNFKLTGLEGTNTIIQIGDEAEAPDTGFGLVASNPAQTLAITGLLAGAIFFVSRRVFARAGVRN